MQPDYKSILSHLRPPEPSAATLWWVFAAVLGAALIFVTFETISSRIRRRREMRKSRDNFGQLSLVCQLNAEEIKLLKHLVSACKIKYPDRLFTSFELFNRCLEDSGPAASGPLTEAEVRDLRIIRNKIFFGERSKLPPVKSTHELRANQWLHLKSKANGKVFMTPVVEAGPSGLLVATPSVKGKHIEVKPGERFDIYFWRDRDASYHFESEVIGQPGRSHLITTLRHVDDIERIQRRQYNRIDTSIPVVATPVTRRELESLSCKEPVEGGDQLGVSAYIINLSGAGFAMAARTELRPNDLVYIELPVEEEDPRVPVIAKILGVTKKETTDEFLMNAEFVGMGAETHEKIFRLIYSQAKHRLLSGP